jgi:predicted type IV restriction endonuclease
MEMQMKQAIERIAELKRSDIGPTEENVKQKVVVPILEFLGHKRESLEFEYRTRRGGKIDIFIRNVPPDCRMIIDTKNYDENLNNHIEQIKEYTFDEAALLTIIANGTEIRIYSPLRGIAFERSLLYSIKRQDLSKESVWAILSNLLHIQNLQSRNVLKKIEERERQIKDAMANEDLLTQEYEERVEGIDSDIETKEEEIEGLRKQKESLAEELRIKTSEIWAALGLPLDLFKIPAHPPQMVRVAPPPGGAKARRVSLRELVEAGLVRDGQTLCFYHTRLFQDEQAEIIASDNKVRYKADGKAYSVSELAKVLLIRHGFKHDEHGVAGPAYWRTKEGQLLRDLNEQVRKQHGY